MNTDLKLCCTHVENKSKPTKECTFSTNVHLNFLNLDLGCIHMYRKMSQMTT